MENRIKMVVLDATKPCKDLNEHLKNSSDSLDWIAKTGTEGMLKLAVYMDKIFDPNLLALLFKTE